MEHDQPVWRLEWDAIGRLLLASCEGGPMADPPPSVWVWRQNLVSEWVVVQKVVEG